MFVILREGSVHILDLGFVNEGEWFPYNLRAVVVLGQSATVWSDYSRR